MNDQVYVLITRSKLEDIALKFINKKDPSIEEVGKVLAQAINLATTMDWEGHVYMGLLELHQDEQMRVVDYPNVQVPASLFRGKT
jgi:hypothetical protein